MSDGYFVFRRPEAYGGTHYDWCYPDSLGHYGEVEVLHHVQTATEAHRLVCDLEMVNRLLEQ